MRKIMAYLGLVDDEYDDYDDLSERSRPAPPRPAPARAGGRPDPRDRDYDYDRGYSAAPPDDYYGARPEPPRMAPVTRIRPMTRDGQPVAGPGMTSPQPAPRATMATKHASSSPHVVAPIRFADAKEIGDYIRQSTPVIVNLQGADRDLQRRMIDFCSGIAYAVGCSMERVADQVFLLTPVDATVSPEDRARLERRGFNRDD
jgi:cell division inhibitor SepF